MSLGRKKLLAAFLEKDNLKLLAYDVFGTRGTRSFAGQISFSPEVVKDAYIADPAKFAGQVKMALAAKAPLSDCLEVVLFLPPDKTFTKSLPASDAVDSFVQSLPYFAEELVIDSQKGGRGPSTTLRTTYVAFEKKLVEDFQKPFLESGKKVIAARSAVNILAVKYGQDGKYFLLAPFDKEIAVAVGQDGAVLEIAAFGRDVFATRFGEFILNHDLKGVTTAYTLGVFDADLAAKLRSERGIEVVSLASGDVYDLIFTASLAMEQTNPLAGILGGIDLGAIGEKIPDRKYLFLAGAAIVGVFLVVMLVRGVGKAAQPKPVTPIASPSAVPAPEPKPADYKVRVLNGTLVEGEAGRLATKLTDSGFNVVEKKNATSAGFVATRLRTVSDVPAKIMDIVKSALDAYQSINLELLASDSAGVKIEIIIGQKK